ncbi:agmatinase [Rhodosalinus halophilus]|uniref:Agmatinase n=1 Tax=Rhodosalinus halophilus TaxID=2259333 RepID=A0A365U6A0_9RHOB|nr:agmatinase [Rhodosalinus halophilus]RBI83778.1 agmatinase [Rhodosalinus halophilus]
MPDRLARLRELSEKTDLNDRTLAEHLRNSGAERSHVAPYAGLCTLLKADLRQPGEPLDIALVGVPFDLGVTNRPGARFGPQQVRELSAMAAGPKHHATGIIPAAISRFADCGDVPIASTYDLERATEEIETYFQALADQGLVPLSVGGDHSISYPILKAVGRDAPVGLVHIDAHADTGGPFNGSRFHHGGPFRNAALSGVLDPERTVQIGIRGRAEPHWDFSYDSGMRVIHIEEFQALGCDAVLHEVRSIVGDGPTYVSFDVDSIDPAFTPGTGTPEVGGFTPREVQTLLRGLRGLNLVGGDVVEVSPPFDRSGNTALVAATMLWEILCLLAEAHSLRQRG